MKKMLIPDRFAYGNFVKMLHDQGVPWGAIADGLSAPTRFPCVVHYLVPNESSLVVDYTYLTDFTPPIY